MLHELYEVTTKLPLSHFSNNAENLTRILFKHVPKFLQHPKLLPWISSSSVKVYNFSICVLMW